MKPLIKICAWCNYTLSHNNHPIREATTEENKYASHGICVSCYREAKKQIPKK